MKKTIFTILAVTVLLASSGCSLWPFKQTASIKQVMLAAEKDKQIIKASESNDSFDGDISSVLFAVEIEGSGKHEVMAEFTQENSNKPIKSEQKIANDNDKLLFSLNQPVTGWLDGSYTVTAYLDNQKIGAKDFTIAGLTEKKPVYDKKEEKNDSNKSVKNTKPEVKTATDATKTPIGATDQQSFKKPKSNPAQIAATGQGISTPAAVANTSTFINASMCNGLTADNGCTSQTTWYYDTVKTFHASTNWSNLRAGDSLWAVWYWEGFTGTGEYLADTALNINSNSSGNFAFSLNNTDNYWYTGNYWVEIYYNGSYFTTIPFAVYYDTFTPTTVYPVSGYYDVYGNYILYDGSGYYDEWGNFWNWGTDWTYDYPEDGYYDEYGNYILDDGTGYYDPYGYFWYWNEWYGDGYYDEYGNYILNDGSGYYDSYGNWWPYYDYENYDGYYDEYGNYILYDGSGYYDVYGNFWSYNVDDPNTYYGPGYYDDYGNWILNDGSGYYDPDGYFWSYYPDYSYDDGYYDVDGNYILYDGSGYYDIYGTYWPWEQYAPVDTYYEDGYYDSYGNYILYDGTGYYDSDGNFYYYDDYYYDDYYYEDYYYDHPNGDIEYWDETYWNDWAA
ncbi:MAG: hypothetical protein WC570_04875 [Patescibacteria group bacterium]